MTGASGCSGFAELVAATNFSFLRGASHPSSMVERAHALGLAGIGIADRNSVAGVVRAHVALRNIREAADEDGHDLPAFRLIVGARLVFTDGTADTIAYPVNRAGWGALTRLLTLGNRRAAKGECLLNRADLLSHAGDMALVVMAAAGDDALIDALSARCSGRLWIGATMPHGGHDRRRLAGLMALSQRCAVPLIATNDPLYATPDQRPLHDVLTCIREKVTVEAAGTRLAANGERHIKSAAEMARLFRDCPDAVAQSLVLLDTVGFSLDELSYHYPDEPVPAGWSAQGWLEQLVMTAAHDRYPGGIPARLTALLDEEFALIARKNYAPYFLTVHDIVAFARAQDPPILCQGRGSAANSAVCFLLGITSVDPLEYDLLFSRFVSEERNEPPDIDVDFEHERREEVMQYIYRRYGRERAAIAATVIHYRPRSAVREVGKVLGFSEDMTSRLGSTVWGSHASELEDRRLDEAGFALNNPAIARFKALVDQIIGFPRHLSQHVGGYILTEGRLDEVVPIHNAAMAGRTFIEWDKDDIDALGLMKVDVLALGMLTCIRKAFDLMRDHGLADLALDTVPPEDGATYDMLCRADSIGVFQVESRAQINMLPRMLPRRFYDLVIQVAIVRPGPIEGDMVHPYMRRRQGHEAVSFPSPAAPHPPDELAGVLGKTLGVPLFQEQAMKLAIVAAGFSGADANRLRRAMATFRNVGTINQFQEKMVEGMVARGYERDFAIRCYRQIEGFGSYGFPESHAISFARLVYVSAWIKCHYPAVFAAALLNAQPMGFYAPAQIVRDAREHGVSVHGVDVNHSDWDNILEPGADGTLALRLGFRQMDGFRRDWTERLVAARTARGRFASVEELAHAAALPQPALRALADADAFASMDMDRRAALWVVRRTPDGALPLFAAAAAQELAAEADMALPVMPDAEQVAIDYQTLRLSLKGHPMQHLRDLAEGEGAISCAATSAAAGGARVRTAGIVLVRQRPGKGNAIFVTIEDESGVTNIVIWARLFERIRRAVMGARLILVDGLVQRSPEGIVHLMADNVHDRSRWLAHLADTGMPVTLSRADEFLHPQHPRTSDHPHRNGQPDMRAARIGRHPRDVRILPRSRDFH